MQEITLQFHIDGTVSTSSPLTKEMIKSIMELHVPKDGFLEEFKNLWNEYATRNNWRTIKEINKDLKSRITKARKDYSTLEQWKVILRGMEADPFFSGKSGVYDRPKPLTLFYKSRYFEFYEAGMDVKVSKVDAILAEFDDFFANAPAVTRFAHLGDA